MANYEQKTQINKDEVIHDLNNLNYLLRALAKMIESTPALPSEIKRLSLGAIAATDKLIAKLGGNSKAIEKDQATSGGTKSGTEELPK